MEQRATSRQERPRMTKLLKWTLIFVVTAAILSVVVFLIM